MWVQEEPENMGAWLMIRHRLEKVLNETKKGFKLSVIARDASAYQQVVIKNTTLSKRDSGEGIRVIKYSQWQKT